MRRFALLIAALACVLAIPPAAGAAVTHVIKGAGWGHGIGMSQYGAYGQALEGRNFNQILGHYYKDTQMGTAPSRPVRVLLQPNDPYIRFNGATRAGDTALSAGATYIARPSGSSIVLRKVGGRRVGTFPTPLRVDRGGEPVKLLGPALNGIDDGRYRGVIEIRTGGGLTAINEIPIDLYVKGVVAGEMPSSWPLEALKAQAVAARTYALATRKPDGPYDQYPDTRSQVYRGVTGESVPSNAAVDGTAGRILTYGGEPAVTFYHSTSGGYTENVELSFIGALSRPWLVGVPDPYDAKSPYHRWQLSFTTGRLTAALGGNVRGIFKRLKVLDRGTSPRIVKARIYGTGGTTTVSGPTLRAVLGLRDTWATFYRVTGQAKGSRSARPASWGGGPARRALAGSFWPAAKGAKLRLERRGPRGWRTIARVRTADRAGTYRAPVDRTGVYRVRRGTVAGAAVRVR